MIPDEAASLVNDLYRSLLKREPGEAEASRWAATLMNGTPFAKVFRSFLISKEFENSKGVRTAFAPGHYYSPIVDPAQITDHLARAYQADVDDIKGININPAAMAAFWSQHEAMIRSTPFTAAPTADRRYYYGDGPYPLGDATILRLMIGSMRPRRIIEIGSGFSSACILDCRDEFQLADLKLTCIEPFPARLERLLRPADRIDLVRCPVQDISPDMFHELQAGDILLIDSTHVLKTGSDVNFELFEILPTLQAGVMIHIHDCQFPFEYPSLWAVKQNFSWNEIYAVRAFLMFNSRFHVFFWNSLFARRFGALAKQTFPRYLDNPGSALWLRCE